MRSFPALGPVDVLGVPVRVRCEDRELARWLLLAWARMPQSGRKDALEGALEREGEGFRVRVDGREPLFVSDPTDAARTLHHELVQAIMRRAPDLYYVHAAVVEVGGAGVLLPGLSQAGKSTLALALVLAGARFLSDELLAFEPESRTAQAFPRAIKIRDVCVPWFPELAGRFVGTGEGRIVPFHVLAPEVVRGRTRVTTVVLPRWSAYGTNELEPLTPGTALLALAASSLNFGTHRQQSIDHLATIVTGTRAFQLAWSDPRAAAVRIARAAG
jgi:hypothetical protein